MSAVNITNVTVLDNPAAFLNPFQFEISYECLVPLKDDLEWKLIYVGSAEDETYDQLLESVLVGPVNVGNYRFVFEADPPDPAKIRDEDIIGVTVLLLTCSFLGQEFIRVGYYVNNDYGDEQLREEPPAKVLIDRVQRISLPTSPGSLSSPSISILIPVKMVVRRRHLLHHLITIPLMTHRQNKLLPVVRSLHYHPLFGIFCRSMTITTWL
ncbi:putative histone chaperone ASF1A [Iris pallida]|uniref:Histone chaperone ASF1A n=2 Tax=Magnoliopsida TaxID=3398 RepID=A0AAX6GCP6_IRIPA|nr:putative histone chaperone ASF1A [Iris pallida]